MSIENNLKRIADALEKIAENTATPATTVAQAVAKQPALVADTPAAPAADVPPAPAADVPPAPAADVPPPPPAAPAAPTTGAAMSDADMNAELVKEFQRLGGRELIDAAMKERGITGVTGLTADVQTELLNAIRAIPVS